MKPLLLILLLHCICVLSLNRNGYRGSISPYEHYSNVKVQQLNDLLVSSGSGRSGNDDDQSQERRYILESKILKSNQDDPSPPPYQTLWYNQTLDHFNFQHPYRFQQRYLVSDQYWKKPGNGSSICDSPILVYLGNEGDIVWFYYNTQFVTNVLSEELNGLVIFIEHRYYGETQPFGAKSSEVPYISYLTTEQALADYAELLEVVLEGMGASHCPVFGFGGSYGGMLSAWMRMKYSNVVDGVLSSSGPILYLYGLVNSETFSIIETNDYKETSEEGTCSDMVLSTLNQIQSMGSTSTGIQQLNDLFNPCDPLSTMDDVENLIGWIEAGLSYMSNCDYPYPSNFFEPLPGNPVNVSCSILTNNINNPLQGMVDMISIYYNYSGQAVGCFNTSQYTNAAMSANNFNYQDCTELVMPSTSNGVDDMFPPSPFNYTQYIEYCQETYQVTPNPQWTINYYGGDNFQASNIIFSNGVRDGWMAGGVTKSDTENGIYAIVMPYAAHHMDLRMPSPLDPTSVTEARQLELKLFQQWINDSSIRKQIKNN